MGLRHKSKYTLYRFWKSWGFAEENGYEVKSSPVHAFIYVLVDLFNMLKNGSRIGYLSLPQHARCSRIWGHPVLFLGSVLTIGAKQLSGSLFFKLYMIAPDF